MHQTYTLLIISKNIHTSNVYFVKIQLKCCEMLFWLQENLLMYHIIWERGLLITVECLFWITDEVKKEHAHELKWPCFYQLLYDHHNVATTNVWFNRNDRNARSPTEEWSETFLSLFHVSLCLFFISFM